MEKLASFYQPYPPLPPNLLKKENPNLKNYSLTRLHALVLTNESSETSLHNHSSCGFPSVDQLPEIKSLESVKVIHARMIKTPSVWRYGNVETELITHYMECGDFRSAATVFLVDFACRNSQWYSMLEQVRCLKELSMEIIKVFHMLNSRGMLSDCRIFAVVLIVCTYVMDMWLGIGIHSCLIKRAFDSDAHVQCALMTFYERCWGIECANQIFNDMVERRNTVWNEAIKLNMKNKKWMTALQLFRDMQFYHTKASSTTFVRVLQACGKTKNLRMGKQIHGSVLRFGLESHTPVCNALISMYARNEELELSRAVFDFMEDCNLASWNSIISAYASCGFLDEAGSLFHKLEAFNIKPDTISWNCLMSGLSLAGLYEAVLIILHKMQHFGCQPNSSSVISALQSVIKLESMSLGKEIHGYVIRHGLDYDVYVETSLLDMYAKWHCMGSARAVFYNMKNRNVCAWNCLMSGYLTKGLLKEAENLLCKMSETGVQPDLVTWSSMVSGYSTWGYTKKAFDIIQEIKMSGLTPDVVSWTALISGCSQNGNYKESLEFFLQMQQEGVKPNATTISSLLQACGGLSLLKKGKAIHCFSVRTGMIHDIFVATTAIDMYCKAGDLQSATEIFGAIEVKSLASFNCMIAGFGMYGLGTEAISLFHKMCRDDISPDAITFTAILFGCKNSGLVTEGWQIFDSMSRDYNVRPTREHYCCMVDLLGRAGFLDEAWDLIQSMPTEPDASIWGALLGCSRIHRNMGYAEIAAKHLFELEPSNPANYLVLMNLYAISKRLKDMERVKELMEGRGLRNEPSWSWIEIDNKVHYFYGGKDPHPEAGQIYFELYHLISEIKKVGYVPDTTCAYQNVDEIEKEKLLLSHTEKLAIAYGLMKRRGGAPIRVIKNSRICNDCHNAAKYISMVQNCEIFAKDGVRFHHFRDGKCSCKDSW